MLNIRDFRAAFPQFTEELFPEAGVEFFLRLASKQLKAERWGDLLPEGMGFFVAHHLSLEREAAASGGMAAAAGPVSSESRSVGGVSHSVTRSGIAVDPAAGHWNLTVYGRRFQQLERLAGAGGAVV